MILIFVTFPDKEKAEEIFRSPFKAKISSVHYIVSCSITVLVGGQNCE